MLGVDSSVHIEIIPGFELFLTILAIKCDGKVLPFNMLVHVSGFVASIATVRARPALFTTRINNFNHLELHNTVQVYAAQNIILTNSQKN